MRIALTQIRPRRSLTWLGRAVLSTIFLLLCGAFFLTLYPFLAPEAPPHRGILVVEGWINDAALDETIDLFHRGDYSYIAATGVQIEVGAALHAWHTYAEMTAERLRLKGIPAAQIITASGRIAQRDRTYTAALALKDQLDQLKVKESELHLISVGPHGRRSRLLFQKAFPAPYRIGITCLEDPSYNADNWWNCSNGVRAIINELIAYGYARVLFHP